MIKLRANSTTKRAAAAKRKQKTQEQLDHIAAIEASESDAANIACDHCAAAVHPLEVFPAQLNGKGSACIKCYIEHVDSKRSDAQRFAAMMSAFGK